MNDTTVNNEPKDATRRSALAAIGTVAAAGVLSPKQAFADDSDVKREDIGKVSFEIANFKQQSDRFERQPNKSATVDESSTDDTYPTAKSVYDYIKGKENYQQQTSDAGKSLFVGTDGNTTLKTYTVDDSLQEYSTNPVQGKVLYQEISKLKESVGLDNKPTKHENSEEGVTKDLKYVCNSNGYWVTYQQAQDAPSNLQDCEMGVNYTLKTKDVSSTDETWAVKKVDDAYVALCEGEAGAGYCGTSASKIAWKAPTVIWHS